MKYFFFLIYSTELNTGDNNCKTILKYPFGLEKEKKNYHQDYT